MQAAGAISAPGNGSAPFHSPMPPILSQLKQSARRALNRYRTRSYAPLLGLAGPRFRAVNHGQRTADPLPAEPWSLDEVDVGSDRLTVRGWSIPADAAVEPRQFTFNGRPFDEIRYPLPRPDVGALFAGRPAADRCGFQCSTTLSDTAYPNGVLEIERVRPGATPIDRGRDCAFVPDPAAHIDLPDEDRRFRVIGNKDRTGFLTTGATDYYRLDRAIAAISGRRLHEFDRVLDWGSGCGRVARHFPARAAARFTGCDIDHDNVRWCSAHLPGTFVPSTVVPPLPFEPGVFDVVYGISVFTHLRERLQHKWLAELARITAKGAYLLMTVHGPTTIEFAHLAPHDSSRLQAQVERSGLLVTSRNSQIDGHADHRGEYVNVSHSHDYIRREWSRHFDVLEIVPGYIFTHDLVVLRKP